MKLHGKGFPGGIVVKNLPANAGDTREADSIPGSGRSTGEGNGNLLQYSCLENSMDRGAWRACGHEESDVTEHARTPENIAQFTLPLEVATGLVFSTAMY